MKHSVKKYFMVTNTLLHILQQNSNGLEAGYGFLKVHVLGFIFLF